ncbi:hypothetical protein GRJ2_000220300 [Grus japonensis]|uniref:Uncharacterized protein n=1 Tax=Grus japonensis TaxID=30415 RepID=A0ABC9VVX9_GRUJA
MVFLARFHHTAGHKREHGRVPVVAAFEPLLQEIRLQQQPQEQLRGWGFPLYKDFEKPAGSERRISSIRDRKGSRNILEQEVPPYSTWCGAGSIST